MLAFTSNHCGQVIISLIFVVLQEQLVCNFCVLVKDGKSALFPRLTLLHIEKLGER